MVWLVDSGTFERGLVHRRRTREGEITPHWGLDVSGALDTPVRAVLDGTILWSGRRISGYGITVAIRHHDRLSTMYGHLNQAVDLGEGTAVTAGMIVGQMGRTCAGYNGDGIWVEPTWCRGMGVHLHWEVHPRARPRLGRAVERLDPVIWLKEHGVDMVRP
jgi:murein DD-endopeptidase MepM/ murein hydrolase activator NlpD